MWGALATIALAAAVSPESLRGTAIARMRAAADYFDANVRRAGGYAWHALDADLDERWGDAHLTAGSQGMAQSPGTADVTIAMAEAYAADPAHSAYKAYAMNGALALRLGQVKSGGWRVYIDATGEVWKADYRFASATCCEKGSGWSTMDDQITPNALVALMKVDALDTPADDKIHESVLYAWPRIRDAQFPELGAWPQAWQRPVERRPALSASAPANDAAGCGLGACTKVSAGDYWVDPTINDDIPSSIVEMLAQGKTIYGNGLASIDFDAMRARYQKFLRLAQMPAPQPLWAQQYDAQMKPRWARAWETPALAGSESQDVMWTLLRLFQMDPTQKENLRRVGAALDYLEAKYGADPQIDRYIEIGGKGRGFCTRRPAYEGGAGSAKLRAVITAGYGRLNCPGGYNNYAWKVPSETAALRAEYNRLLSCKPGSCAPRMRTCAQLKADTIKAAITDIHEGNRWRTKYAGHPRERNPTKNVNAYWLDTSVFAANMRTLAEYVTRTALPASDLRHCARD